MILANESPRRTRARFAIRIALLSSMFVLIAGNEDCEGVPTRITADLVQDFRIQPVLVGVTDPDELQRDSNEDPANRIDNQPYFGAIRFTSKFGVVGSTDVKFIDRRIATPPIGQLTGCLGGGGGPGGLCTVSGGSLSAGFPEWTLDEFYFGHRIVPHDPDSANAQVAVDGIIIVAMEGDSVGWDPRGADGVKDVLSERAGCLRTSLATHVEPYPWSVGNFLTGLQNVRDDVDNCGADGEGGLAGGASLIASLKRVLGKLVSAFINPDDPMGSAFLVRLGVPFAYYEDFVLPWLSLGGNGVEQVCEDGSRETVVSGCTPFLSNPCAMKTDPSASSQYASICATGERKAGDYRPDDSDLALIPFENAASGKWVVMFLEQID